MVGREGDMKLTYKGKFTSGYYNDMEVGYPVFIDDLSLSDLVKHWLIDNDMDDNFCDDMTKWPSLPSDNPLIGKTVTLTLEWSE